MVKFGRFIGLVVLGGCVIACSSLDVEYFMQCDANNNSSMFLLIDRSADILCSFDATAIYVFFENYTSMGHAALILKKLNECGTSFISLRNKFRTAPLGEINDDGVIMYLVLMIKNASQRIDLSMVKKKSASKDRSYFFVLVEDSEGIDEAWLHTAFKQFWGIWVLNAVIMFWRDNDIRIYTYSPFSKRFLNQLDPKITVRDDLFPSRVPNMNGRQLTICLYPDEVRALFQADGRILGVDGFMSSFIAERLNATKKVKLPSEYNYQISSNTSADFCLNEMINSESDIALNTRFLSPDTFQNQVEHTVVYDRDDLCVLVPKAQPASLFWNLFRSFEISVWLAIALMFLITFAFCRILLPHADQTALKLYSTMLTQPLSDTSPRTSVRLFLICWFSYCLLISGAYKCNLTTNLVFRISLPEIDSLWQLSQAKHDILIYSRHQKLIDKLLDSAVPHLNNIKRKTIPVTDEFFMKKLDGNDQSFAYLEKFHVAYFRANSRKHTQRGRPLFHLMKTCPIPFQAVYVVPYGSPYLGFLNALFRRVHEHGFVGYWTKIMDTQFKHSGKSVVRNSYNDDDPVVLKLAHLQAAFCTLGLGLTLGTVILFWEIYQVYGIRMFIYNRQRWNADHLKANRTGLHAHTQTLSSKH